MLFDQYWVTPEDKIRYQIFHNIVISSPAFSVAGWLNFKKFGRGHIFFESELNVEYQSTGNFKLVGNDENLRLIYATKGDVAWNIIHQNQELSNLPETWKEFYHKIENYNPRYEIVVLGRFQGENRPYEHWISLQPSTPPYLARRR